jgi:hypothetical protein
MTETPSSTLIELMDEPIVQASSRIDEIVKNRGEK